MTLVLDDQQQAIRREAERIVSETSDTARLLGLLDAPGEFDEPLWQVARENGWCAIAVPEEHGGLGLGLSEVGLVCEALGRAPAGMPFVLTNYGVTVGLVGAGEKEVADRWLPRLASGEVVGAVAFAESYEPMPSMPGVAFLAGSLRGTKPAVAAGAIADCALVLAQADGDPVLALADLTGLPRKPIASYDPTRGHADLAFHPTQAQVIAAGQDALDIARNVQASLAVAAACEQLGGAEALLRAGCDYANTRKAFGQPIGAFQAVKHRLAELYGLIEIARANCAQAAEHSGKAGFLAAAAAARLAATEAYDTAARDCVQIHGGIGVTWDLGLHLHMRRARSLASEWGNTLFWEDVLVDELVEAGV
jgi:acyl-CoA dehydrogenase